MARPAALHESALSPQEYDEYSGLTRAFESSFPSTSRLPPQEVWEWLLQWLGQADSRTEKEILSFFRVPTASTSGAMDYPPSSWTLLALARLYSHSRDTRHLTRDLIFVATDPVVFAVAPKSTQPSISVTAGHASAGEGAPPIPPQRSASLQQKSGNPFRRTGSSAAVGLGTAPAQDFPSAATSSSSPSSTPHQRAVSAPHAAPSTSSSVSSKEPPPPPPPKRLVSAQSPSQTAEASSSRPTNPFLTLKHAAESKLGGPSALPVSPPASIVSSSSQPRSLAHPANTAPPTPSASSIAGSLPPLPPRPSIPSSGKPAPPVPSSSTKPPLAPRRSTKLVTLAGGSETPPPPPSRRSSLPASNSTRQSSTQPRLSIISSSSASSPRSASGFESHSHPAPPPSKLTSSTHIGINSSVRLVPSNHLVDDPSSSSGGQSGASSTTGGSGTVRGRMSRSNSGLSAGGDSSAGGGAADVIGQKGFRYEPSRGSPRKGGRGGGRSRSRSASKPTAVEGSSRPKDARDGDDSSDDTYSIRTDPLPSTSTFRSFSTASVHPPAPSSLDGFFQPTGTLAGSRTLGDKPFKPPPPPKRRVEENPFETPGGGAIGLGRASSMGSLQHHHQRTTSLTSRASSGSTATTAKRPKEFGSEVASFIVQGAREGARAAEGLVRRTSSVRKPSGKGERDRLVESSSSEDEGEDGLPLGAEDEEIGEEDEEMEVRMKELERGVRETAEKGQWRALS